MLEDCHIERCFDECLAQSDFSRRQREIEAFNAEHRYRKRGLAAVPVRFGISFVAKHMNQAGALVQIYRDGSVLITHSGVEIGQGLHTKMIQVDNLATAHYNVPYIISYCCPPYSAEEVEQVAKLRAL